MIGTQERKILSQEKIRIVSWYLFPNSFATKHLRLSLNFLLYHIVFDNEGLLKELFYYLNYYLWSLCNGLLCDFLELQTPDLLGLGWQREN